MVEKSVPRLRSAFRFVCVAMLYMLVASAVLHAFMAKWGFRGDSSFGLESLLSHTTYKPFVYRLLSPVIVKSVSELVPESLVEKAAPFLLEESSLLVYRVHGESWNVGKSLHFHIAYGYLFSCLMAVLLLVRRLTQTVYDSSPLAVDVSPAIALLFLPLTFHLGGYLYDFPELVFLFAAVVCILERRFLVYYAVFILAILNKESNVLIAGLFGALLYGQIEHGRLLKHLSLQGAVGIALLVAVRYYFRDADGSGAEFHLWENIRFWLSPQAYSGVIEGYAPLIPLPQGFNLVTLFLVLMIIMAGWAQAPRQTRLLLTVSLAMNIPLMVVFGYLDEIRILSLSFPAFYLFCCHAFPALYGIAVVRRSGS